MIGEQWIAYSWHMSYEPIELEEGSGASIPEDARWRMVEPPPVSLVAVADVTLPAPAGCEWQLDDFYVGLLGFWSETSVFPAYRADNFILRFEVVECRRSTRIIVSCGSSCRRWWKWN